MKEVQCLQQKVLSDEVTIAPEESEYALKIAAVYQDAVTRDRGIRTCSRAKEPAGEERIENKWYAVNFLSDPANFLDAARAALVADLILVSFYAADELPLDPYVRFEASLPCQLTRSGALAALISVADSHRFVCVAAGGHEIDELLGPSRLRVRGCSSRLTGPTRSFSQRTAQGSTERPARYTQPHSGYAPDCT